MRISDWSSDVCSSDLDAKRAADIGATAIMVSNHGGRQLDGSLSPFDALADIVDAVGDRVEVICDGGITRGTHVLKALSVSSEEHTSELQSLMRISYAVFCLKKKIQTKYYNIRNI